jgi:predicted O-methyltransferase YrrM
MFKGVFMLRSLCLLLIGTSCIFGKSQQDLPAPYNTARILPFNEKGWYLNGAPLAKLIRIHQVETIIEVGCWIGLSTRHLASCLPTGGIVYAVDHWKGSPEHQPGQSAWSPDLALLYEYFLSNVIHERLTDKIIPIRMDSLTAAKELNVMADLIYIDASHETPAVYADMVAWYPHLKENGVFCGDDWTYPSVRAAVRKFAVENQLKIEASENFWRLKK